MNADTLRKALDKVGNPNVLVNLISRRVRQLNAAGGNTSRPLIIETATLGAADIALSEFVEEKMSWEQLDTTGSETGPAKRRRKN